MSRRLTMRRKLGEYVPIPPDSREITGFWVRLQRLEDGAMFWYEGAWYRWLTWEFDPEPISHSKHLDIDDLHPDTAVFVVSLAKVDTTWPDKPQAGAVVIQTDKPKRSIPRLWKDLRIGDEFNFILDGQIDSDLFIKCSDNMAEAEGYIAWRSHDSLDPVHFVRSTLD